MGLPPGRSAVEGLLRTGCGRGVAGLLLAVPLTVTLGGALVALGGALGGALVALGGALGALVDALGGALVDAPGGALVDAPGGALVDALVAIGGALVELGGALVELGGALIALGGALVALGGALVALGGALGAGPLPRVRPLLMVIGVATMFEYWSTIAPSLVPVEGLSIGKPSGLESGT